MLIILPLCFCGPFIDAAGQRLFTNHLPLGCWHDMWHAAGRTNFFQTIVSILKKIQELGNWFDWVWLGLIK